MTPPNGATSGFSEESTQTSTQLSASGTRRSVSSAVKGVNPPSWRATICPLTATAAQHITPSKRRASRRPVYSSHHGNTLRYTQTPCVTRSSKLSKGSSRQVCGSVTGTKSPCSSRPFQRSCVSPGAGANCHCVFHTCSRCPISAVPPWFSFPYTPPAQRCSA